MVDNGIAQFGADVAELAAEVEMLFTKAQRLQRLYDNRGIKGAVETLPNDADGVDGTSFDKQTLMETMSAVTQLVTFLNGGAITAREYVADFDKAAALAV